MSYLIDGYNFLFWLKPDLDELERAREEWIHALAEKLEETPWTVTIVFDSQYQPTPSERFALGTLEIVFTNQNETADEWILEHVSFQTVVTSDKRLGMHVRSLGAKTMSCQEFLKLVTKKRKKRPKKPLKPIPRKEPEVLILPPKNLAESFDYYLDLFQKKVEEGEKKALSPKKEKPSKKVIKTKREKRSTMSEMERWRKLFEEGDGA